MLCPSCGAGVQPNQKFCTECGASLAGTGTAVVAPPPLPPPAVMPPTAAVPSQPAQPTAAQFEPTAALKVVEQTSPTGYEGAPWAATTGETTGQVPITGEWPAGAAGEPPRPVGAQPFRITPLVAVSALAAVLAVACAFVAVASYSVDLQGPVEPPGLVPDASYKLNDFASNYTVGAIIAAVVMVAGAAMGATGRKAGTGLAGGAGLALAGMMSMMIGQAIQELDGVEFAFLGFGGSFTLTTTQEVGFFLALAAAILGGVAFALSLMDGSADEYPTLNPAVGLVGALGTLAVVVGPLIPMNGAAFGDNFSVSTIPPATLYLRLLVLVLIGVGGLVGFLVNRRWGVGMALGAISVGAWQWVTAITESGDFPLGIGGGNFFAEPFAPHIVTSIGVVVMLLAGVAGALVAAQQRNAR